MTLVMSNTLKNDVVSGLKWSLIAKLLTQVFSWVSTFLVIRWLTPEDYGIVGIAMIFFMFISMFTTNGLTSAIVKESKRGIADNQIFSISLLMNILLSLILAACAPWISSMMNSPDLKYVIWVLAAANPITSFAVVPNAHLQMEMKFKEKAIADTASGLVGAVAALWMAYCGMAYWALIFSGIIVVWVRVAVLNHQSKSSFRVCFKRQDWIGVKDRLIFGGQVQVGTLIWYIHSQADVFIVGKLLGMEKAGTYSVAAEIAAIPISKVSAVLNDVAFSAFNKVKHDRALAVGHALKAMRLIGAFAFPVFFGLSLVSNELIVILLGEKWAQAGIVMAIMCFGFPFKMVNSVLGNYAMGMGNARFGLNHGIIMAILIISSIYVGTTFFGIVGAAAGWLTGTLLSIAYNQVRFHLVFDFKFSELLVCWPALLISSLMYFVVQLSATLLSGQIAESVWILMVFKIIVGIFVAAPLLWWVYSKELRAVLSKS